MIEIPGYTILGKVGQGGMATVYRARQVLLDRDVALKVMSSQLAQDEAYAHRFLQEARMLAALNHPNVVQVYDVGVTPTGLHYFSMALLPGGDFAQRMREGLSETELLRVLVAVATALGFAHARGYVHRDVTPGNILFDAHDTPVLTDFGIARALSAVSRLTSSGMSIGTSHYMSPEQARGSADIDHRADIYGLGVLCYEAVAGETPFRGEDSFAVAFAHVNDPVPRLPEEVARWQPLIDKAMAKNPAERFQNCSEFIDGLRQVAPQEFATLRPVAAPPPPRRTPPPVNRRPGPGGSKKPLLIGAAALLGLLLIAVLLWWLFGRGPAAPKPPPAAAPVAATQAVPRQSVPPPVAETPLDAAGDGDPDGPDGDAGAAPIDGATDNPDAAAALAAAMAHTVRDPVAALLEAGRANLVAQRLTSPPVTNAFDRFKLALVMEPANEQAGEGIANVGRALLQLAAGEAEAEDPGPWLARLAQVETVAAAHPAAAPLLTEVRAAREQRANRRIAEGEAAIRDFRRDQAVAAFGDALRVLPGLAAAERGLAEARKVGTPGYVFRDALKTRGAGPEMVVARVGLALGKHEVTRGEFAAYWSAAGAARLGGSLPNCRDRNTGAVFGGSRRRTWEAPDVSQDARHPVVCVSLPMVEGYIGWLAEQTGRRYRLPTAAELAPYTAPLVADCSANLRDGRTCQDGHAGTAPVGSYAARSPGLFDTVGNASEWTSDCDKPDCRERVTLGGNWNSEPGEPIKQARPADTGFNTVGFRLVREID